MNRLLIVDDALIMRMKIRQIAEQAGWTVVAEGKDGTEAVRLFAEHEPDLMTLDMVMPNMDGVSALKKIRANHPRANIVMVSAVDQKEKLAECISAGAMDFIVKPFNDERLQAFFENAQH